MFDKIIDSRFEKKFNLNVCINLLIVIVFVFTNSFLEEDLLIGGFSTLIFFFFFCFIKEIKSVVVREFRLKVKKVFRIQNKLLKRYYFFYRKIMKIHLKYLKKILVKNLIVKYFKVLISTNLKLNFFFSRLIYIKAYYFNYIIIFLIKTNMIVLKLF